MTGECSRRGATGFVGRALILGSNATGMPWSPWVRLPARARGLLGAEVELVHADTAPDGLVGAIERSDAVVNLAGEPLMGGRWTAARRAVLEGSRTTVTGQLVRAMAEADEPPARRHFEERRRLLRTDSSNKSFRGIPVNSTLNLFR